MGLEHLVTNVVTKNRKVIGKGWGMAQGQDANLWELPVDGTFEKQNNNSNTAL